jgi:hypothetical protein
MMTGASATIHPETRLNAPTLNYASPGPRPRRGNRRLPGWVVAMNVASWAAGGVLFAATMAERGFARLPYHVADAALLGVQAVVVLPLTVRGVRPDRRIVPRQRRWALAAAVGGLAVPVITVVVGVVTNHGH